MTIHIQNVLTKKKEEFTPVVANEVRIYICGVTVYGRCHVGHLRCYLSFDAVLRYFRYRGFDVKYVRNFTDIDDKIIARAGEIEAGPQGDWRSGEEYATFDEEQWVLRLKEDELIRGRAKGQDRHMAEVVSDYFIDVFRNEDFGSFDLLQPVAEPRVSENIPEVIALIERIIEKGFAYDVDGDVYFDVPAYHDATKTYGILSGRDFTQLIDGARVATTDVKRSAPDFALWKRSGPGEPAWPSPWGNGRPGWHIECSAMSINELGQPFDIHGGGKDLIFPHHENEIAQSEAASGIRFCNTWIHNGFVTVDGVKMSKSLGNFITIREALEMAPPEVWRFLALGTHYANPIDFSRTREVSEVDNCNSVRGTIDIAFERVEYFYETLKRAGEATAGAEIPDGTPLMDDPRVYNVVDGFTEAMDDDFNTAKAVARIGEAMRLVNELCDMKAKSIKKIEGGRVAWQATIEKVQKDILEVSQVLGLCVKDPSLALEELRGFLVRCHGLDCEAIETRLEERSKARDEKDWAKSDALRDVLLELGVEVRDGPSGTEWKVVR